MSKRLSLYGSCTEKEGKDANEVEINVVGKMLGRNYVVECFGVLLDDKMKFVEHVKAVMRKACVGLAKLRMLQHSLPSNMKI